MPGRFFLFNIAGAPVLVHPTYLLLVLLSLTAYRSGTVQQNLALGFLFALGLFVSVLLHEVGHVLAARRFGIKTQAIEIYGLGGRAHFDRAARSRGQTIAICLAGPAVNLVLYLLGWGGLELLYQWNVSALQGADGPGLMMPPGLFQAVHDFGWMNGFLLVFNMLPAFPLDGGKALREILAWPLGNPRSTRLVAIIGMILGVGLLGLTRSYGIGMLILCLFMVFENWQVYQNTR